jgi:hypothetical protein
VKTGPASKRALKLALQNRRLMANLALGAVAAA